MMFQLLAAIFHPTSWIFGYFFKREPSLVTHDETLFFKPQPSGIIGLKNVSPNLGSYLTKTSEILLFLILAKEYLMFYSIKH